MSIFHSLLHGFTDRVVSGKSWLLVIVIFVVSGLLGLMCMKHNNMVGEWAFEPIISIPKRLQQTPFVKTWFALTRGFHYATTPKPGTSTIDAIKDAYKQGPTKQIEMDALFSGWAFLHFLQHFCLAFFCPKLAYVGVMFGIVWEITESATNAHCVLDILWNVIGMLMGLLCRSICFPVQSTLI